MWPFSEFSFLSLTGEGGVRERMNESDRPVPPITRWGSARSVGNRVALHDWNRVPRGSETASLAPADPAKLPNGRASAKKQFQILVAYHSNGVVVWKNTPLKWYATGFETASKRIGNHFKTFFNTALMRSSAPGAIQFQSCRLPSRSRTACSVGI